MPEPSEADVIAMSQHPLHAVWCAGGDASNSPDFRNPDGELDEEAYIRYGLNVMRRAYAEVAARVWREAVAALRDGADAWTDGAMAQTVWRNAAAYLQARGPNGGDRG